MAEPKVYSGGEFLIAEASPDDVFTPEDFTQEHRMIYETAMDFVKNEVWPVSEEVEQKTTDIHRRIHKKAGELGLLSTDVPEEYGGMGLDKVSTSCVGDAMARAGSYVATHAAHTGIATLPIVYFGNEAQKKKYLPKLASGEWIGSYCLTEASAGSDALSGRTRAVLSEDGKHYILNGEKMFITNAGWADSFIVYAKIDDKDFTAFIVERDYPGLSFGAEEKKMGGHGSSTRSVVLEDVKVPVENMLYEIGKGHKIAFGVLNLGRWKLGAGSAGGAKEGISQAIRYANGREQFNAPISSFGMIKSKIADMTVRCYVTESILYRVAGMLDAKLATLDEAAKNTGTENSKAIDEYAVECSITKVHGSECLDFCVDEWVQILGGYGYCAEYPAERAYRDARINRIWEGTNEINRLLIPGTLFKRALQGRLNLLGASQSVASFIMSYSPLSIELPEGPLGLQQHLVAMSKKLTLMVAGLSAQKFMAELQKEQEVLALLADMVIENFAMETALLRAQKALANQDEEKSRYHAIVAKLYIDETIPKMENWAKRLLAYVEDGDMLRTQLAAVKKLARYQQIDTISLKRELADRAIDLEQYPFVI
jgi:alkylation response protein AidB-like acyl-CoA dehydrogenase